MKRLVLAAPTTRSELVDYFYEGGWNYIQEHAPTVGDRFPHTIGWAKGKGRPYQVHFVDEVSLGVQFFVISSSEPDKLEVIESRVRSGPFTFSSVDDAVREFDTAEDPGEISRSLAKIALLAPKVRDPWFESQLERGFRHGDSEVRAKCVEAITYVGWPELKGQIENMCRDPDERVRENARVVLEGYGALGIA